LDQGRIREALASVWPVPRRNEPSLLHGDYWPGNILWREGQLAAVIDWEDAHVGDPLEDFAISRLDMLWIFGRDAMQSFSRHYQAVRAVDIRALPYWDLYAALRLARLVGTDLLGWAAFFLPYGRPDITGQSIQASCSLFVAQAFEQLADLKHQ
jgi:aminoglycoside phosphotransferase (APT) family kinase protein